MSENTKGVTVAQLNIAQLLLQYEWILSIPDTKSIQHLEENINPGNILLSKEV